MMNLMDIDPHFVSCLGCLHAQDLQSKEDKIITLQHYLEEAIKMKSGITKDFTGLVSLYLKQEILEEYKPLLSAYDESKTSNSDNELELDLLKEDLMCIICNGMDVGARNRLLECSDCHSLYHQECHRPVVTNEDAFDTWICQNCKDASSRKMKQTIPSATSSSVVSSTTSGSSKSSKSVSSSSSSSHRHSSSNAASSYKVSSSSSSKSSDKYKSSSSSSKSGSSVISKVSSTTGGSTSSSSRTAVAPNINIISADKRIQIMKKKAAKLQEKRKQLPR